MMTIPLLPSREGHFYVSFMSGINTVTSSKGENSGLYGGGRCKHINY